MPPKWKGKQAAPRRKGKKETIQVSESLNCFITLRLGKEAFERLLENSRPDFLRWTARNALLATQAQKIRDQYQLVEEVNATVAGETSAIGGVTDIISESLESHIDSRIPQSSDADEVSPHSIHTWAHTRHWLHRIPLSN